MRNRYYIKKMPKALFTMSNKYRKYMGKVGEEKDREIRLGSKRIGSCITNTSSYWLGVTHFTRVAIVYQMLLASGKIFNCVSPIDYHKCWRLCQWLFFCIRFVEFVKRHVIDKHHAINYTHAVVSTPLSLNFIVNANKRRTIWAISTQTGCANLICVAPLVLSLLVTIVAYECRALLCYTRQPFI